MYAIKTRAYGLFRLAVLAEAILVGLVNAMSVLRNPMERRRAKLDSATAIISEGEARDLPLPPLSFSGAIWTVVLIDVSGSMDSPDYPPTRLEAAQEGAKKYFEARCQLSPKDFVALVTFAGSADRCCDWTSVRTGKSKFIQAVDSIKTRGSTSIGAGLAKAIELLEGKPSGFLKRLLSAKSGGSVPPSCCLRRIIVLTDGGQNAAPAPRSIAKRAKDAGMVIECIGIGAREEIDEDLLKAIASVVDGRIRYRYIGDVERLSDQFRRLGGLTR